jgi:hypothetical protein
MWDYDVRTKTVKSMLRETNEKCLFLALSAFWTKSGLAR